MERGWRSGPRLPSGPRLTGEEDIGDPGDGETLPRCFSCGVPAPITGTFIPDDGPFAGRILRYRICLRCLEHANGPLRPDPKITDPLTVAA